MLATVLAVGSILVALPARAVVVTPRMPFADWAKTGGGEATEVKATYNMGIDPVALPWQRPPNFYWATQFVPANSPSGGYFGFQKKSFSPNKVVLFSWWNALDASCPGVPNLVSCGPFAHEGNGYSAMVAFNWQAQTPYTLRMWRGAPDAARNAYWWNLEIQDGTGTKLASVGALLVPAPWGGITGAGQWTEWFAGGTEAADHCDQIPQTDTWSAAPLFDGVSATPRQTGTMYDGPCPAEAFWSDGGTRQRMGTSTPATTTSSTTTTTTLPPPVTAQNPRSIYVLPPPSLDGLGVWIATANDPAATAGQVPASYLYAQLFTFSGNSTATGFVGLVTSPAGKFAMLAAKEPGGKAYAALVPFNWKSGQLYFPFVHQLGAGQWGGWIYDYSAASWVPIGIIAVPQAWSGLSGVSSTSASWSGSTAPSCSAFPSADVFFSRPVGYLGGQATTAALVNHTTSAGDCLAMTSTDAGGWTHYRVGKL